MDSANDFLIILSTAPSQEMAEQLANGLVSSKLVACVNILPSLTSIYEWQGKVEKSSECLLICKSMKSSVDQAFKYLNDHHPYDCPELIALPVESISASYGRWLSEALS